jgi:chaperonin cofactor prefoldin
MAAQQLPNLPNFPLMEQALGTFKTEVVKVANLPAWDEGATIITQLGQFMTRIEQRFEQMDQRFEQRFEQMDQRFEQMDRRFEQMDRRFEQMDRRFEQRFEQMETRMDQRFQQVFHHLTVIDASIQTITARLDATQHNTNAQFANYIANSDTSPLVPLHHSVTNEDIPGFPATTGDIGLLNRQMIDTIIEALGGSADGTLEKKKFRLRRLVGLIPVPLA